MITVPFSQLIHEDSPIWNIINRERFPHLYPPDVLPEDVIENINAYFYDRQIAYSSPERFLLKWYRLIKERAYTWLKLLETEKVLRNEDMLFNYDLNESSTDTRTGSGHSKSINTPNLKTIQTPDLLNVTKGKNDTDTSSITNTNEVSNNLEKLHDMDTPDGITTDIDNYLSRAQKNTTNENINTSNANDTTQKGTAEQIYRQTGRTVTDQTGNSETETDTNSLDENAHSLRRYGNIGTMTVASVLGGYRDAQSFDAYSSVIFPELENLFLHFVELEEVFIW